MGSTKKRRVPRKSTTTKLREKVADLEGMLDRSRAQAKQKYEENLTAMGILRGCLPESKTEHVTDLCQMARLAARAASIGQTISSGATKALRAAGYMPTGPEDVAARIGGALFLKEGQRIVYPAEIEELRRAFENIIGGNQ